jgi:hypothetical protein
MTVPSIIRERAGGWPRSAVDWFSGSGIVSRSPAVRHGFQTDGDPWLT